MKKKLAVAAALASLALTLSACLVINLERRDKDGKSDHVHGAVEQSV